jgi:fucose 4-O-acetylase-like acetyltransferase
LLEFIKASLENPVFLVGHLIAFSVLIFLSLSSVYIHKKIAGMTTISDALVICITPAILLFLYELSSPERNLEYLFLLLPSNTILLIVGGLIGWFLCH